MSRKLPFEIEAGIINAVEHAAISAYAYVGSGDELSADKVAISAMHEVLSDLAMDGKILFGEGDEFDSELLYDGEKIGQGTGAEYDIALDALEGTTLAAKALHNALSVIAIAPKGGLFPAPNVYMNKIAIGPNFPEGIVDLDNEPAENVMNIAKHLNIDPNRVGVCVLDRPRHANLIAKLREVGARVFLISDGDVAGVLFTSQPHTEIHIYMGIGGAHEGVLAAAALSCTGGQFQGRLMVSNDEHKIAMRKSGISDISKKYTIKDLIKSPVIFAACGLTSGTLLKGVRLTKKGIETQTICLNSETMIARLVNSSRLSPK